MSLSGLLLGVINIAIVVAAFVLIGAIIMWFCSMFSWAVPPNVQKAYLLVVALIALYMLVALALGIPTIRIIHSTTTGGDHVAMAQGAVLQSEQADVRV